MILLVKPLLPTRKNFQNKTRVQQLIAMFILSLIKTNLRFKMLDNKAVLSFLKSVRRI